LRFSIAGGVSRHAVEDDAAGGSTSRLGDSRYPACTSSAWQIATTGPGAGRPPYSASCPAERLPRQSIGHSPGSGHLIPFASAVPRQSSAQSAGRPLHLGSCRAALCPPVSRAGGKSRRGGSDVSAKPAKSGVPSNTGGTASTRIPGPSCQKQRLCTVNPTASPRG